MKFILRLFWLLLFVCGASSLTVCSRENGLPDPPVQELVPCVPDAGADDPLVCPEPTSPAEDGGAD